MMNFKYVTTTIFEFLNENFKIHVATMNRTRYVRAYPGYERS